MISQIICISSLIFIVSAARYPLTRALEQNIKHAEHYQDRLDPPPEGPKADDLDGVFRTKICKGLKCPEFSQEGASAINFSIQKRFYTKAKFITAISKDPKCDYDSAIMDAYMELYRYRNGSNERGEKFNMTTPVLTLVYINHLVKGCQEKYKIMFYLPPELQDDPPHPSSNAVMIEEILGYSVYVHSFSGHIEKRLTKELELFHALSKYIGLCYDHSDYFTAVYDAPWRKTDRRNEIWFSVANDC